jgi:Zn2+/Cd2+-exporting ATPase
MNTEPRQPLTLNLKPAPAPQVVAPIEVKIEGEVEKESGGCSSCNSCGSSQVSLFDAPVFNTQSRAANPPTADHPEKDRERRRLLEIGLASVLFIGGTVFNEQLHNTPFAAGEYAVLLTAYFLVGRSVVLTALRNLGRGKLFDENFLMTLATVGAFAIHLLPEAVAVMLFYSVGEYVQERAVNRSRRSIKALLDIRPDYANLLLPNPTTSLTQVRVKPENVQVGARILIKPGERVPLDGTILSGESFLDTSALTGESVPRRVRVGDNVLAGTVNTQGLLTVRVDRLASESSITKILRLVENAARRKAPTEAFISTFSRYYTPGIVIAASMIAFLPPLLFVGQSFSEWLYRALVLLVISCPCALVLSIPLGYFGGIGGASRRGILVKGANYLDALTKLDTVVMDKTGTLTRGVFKVNRVTPFNGATPEKALELAAYAENYSTHPIAASIRQAYRQEVQPARLDGYTEIAGQGVKVKFDGQPLLAGNDRMLHAENIPHDSCETDGGTVVFVAESGQLTGRITISDEIKPEATGAVAALHKLGIKRAVMLTGDDAKVAQQVARDLGIDEVKANLLPEDKMTALEAIIAENGTGKRGRGKGKGKVAFVGDGINDAPVLTRADIGIAMGGLGSDAAIEAADVVIMDDNPAKVATAIEVARRTRRIVIQNIVLALSVKLLFVTLGLMGVATIWEAVFADVGVSVLAILNATRAMRTDGRVGKKATV